MIASKLRQNLRSQFKPRLNLSRKLKIQFKQKQSQLLRKNLELNSVERLRLSLPPKMTPWISGKVSALNCSETTGKT